ncbi:uncharacterized protein A4U43_C09F2480 [Asparagus officinalis]|uniref:DYW domain-containing protein n=1 Tax=Asparagus officinalis TaxID=4686 RepID=A0A5P1E4S3_ASPOF|nr:pentatricopeptide repeat-containing protein At2g13600 [Asparagus officinalis]XP_020246018.1 pentatricopeptide repeat-containing protein At2g13600 [Asparagus officinalis]ONK57631.1 uncharacterized protein A4U43_C09F2480 [Asparagus officinalis]
MAKLSTQLKTLTDLAISNLIQSCTQSQSLTSLQALHAQILKTHFSSQTFILNRLIDSYSKCGSLEHARKLFDAIPQRNTFSWNAVISAFTRAGNLEEARQLFLAMPDPDQCSWSSMVSGFAQHARFEEALDFFESMHGDDFYMNSYSLSSALSASAGLMDLSAGVQIHGLVSKLSLACDVFMGSALVDMYSKCRCPFDAQRVFEEMPEKNVVSWNSLITCYEQNGPVSEALVLFVSMMECGNEPDEKTFASVVSACATLAAIREGTQLHARTIKFDKFRNDLVLSNALVDMYAKCSRIREAKMVFDRMQVRCIVSETSILSGYARSAMVKDARSMLSGMMEKNIIAWNALIAGYTQSGEDEEALRMFLQLKRQSIGPTHYTFGNVLNACANLADLQLGLQAHGHVLKHGFRFGDGLERDIFVGNSLVDMYLKNGSTDEAVKVFESMIQRDRVSWNAMIVGYAQNGCGVEALNIFKRMLSSEEKPDNVTMIGVLSGCSHAGLVDEGRQYFKSMTGDYGLVPSRDHYACMVDLLGRAGHLEEVERFIKEMPIEPDSIIWSSFLASCRTHGNVKMGEWAAERLFKTDFENSGSYVLLSNMYAERGRWEDVLKLRRMMKQKGVVKQPGCSWIEIERKVHVFMVKDKRHPKRKEIYRILKILKMQMERFGIEEEFLIGEC